MPFKSKAQRRYFYANRKDLESQGVDIAEWERETGKEKLPEKVDKAAWYLNIPLEKLAISTRAIMRAAVNAHNRGASPERMRKFWDTTGYWLDGAPDRLLREVDAISASSPLSKSRSPLSRLSHGSVVKSVLSKLRENGVPSHLLPTIRVSDRIAPRNSFIASSPEMGMQIMSNASWPSLLHEAGHALDFSKRFRGTSNQIDFSNMARVGDSLSGTLLNEAMANRGARVLARALGQELPLRALRPAMSSYEIPVLQQLRNNPATAQQLPRKFQRVAATIPPSV